MFSLGNVGSPRMGDRKAEMQVVLVEAGGTGAEEVEGDSLGGTRGNRAREVQKQVEGRRRVRRLTV